MPDLSVLWLAASHTQDHHQGTGHQLTVEVTAGVFRERYERWTVQRQGEAELQGHVGKGGGLLSRGEGAGSAGARARAVRLSPRGPGNCGNFCTSQSVMVRTAPGQVDIRVRNRVGESGQPGSRGSSGRKEESQA